MEDHELLAAVYCRFRKSLYLDYMRGVKLLARYAADTTTDSHINWLPSPANPNDTAIDCCSNCGCSFGPTLGGRLRDRCFSCRSTANSIGAYEVQELSLIWRISQERVTWLLSCALALETAYNATSKFKASLAQLSESTSHLPEEVRASEADKQGTGG